MYNTVNIITAPAITRKNGDVACVTFSTATYHFEVGNERCGSDIFSNINTYVHDYFSTEDHEVSNTKSTTFDLRTTTIATTKSLIRVSFATPFVYQPDWGINADYRNTKLISTASGLGLVGIVTPDELHNPQHGKGYPDYGFEDYGYIPKVLVDALSSDAKLSVLFLGSSSLRPAGPRLEKPWHCEEDSGAMAVDVQDLTDSSAQTVDNIGCFHPGVCLSVNTPAAATTAQMIDLAPKTAKTQTAPNQGAPTVQAEISQIRGGVAPPRLLPSQGSATRKPNGRHPDQRPPKIQPNPTQAQSTLVETGIGNSQPPKIAPVIEQASILPTIDSATGDRNPPKAQPVPAVARIITLGSSTLIADSATNFVIGSQNLAPGSSPIVVSGTTYSLLPSASALVANGKTLPLAIPQSQLGLGGIIHQAFGNSKVDRVENSGYKPTKVIKIGSQTITANPASQYVVQGQTLAAGAAPITVGANTYSLASSGSALVINGVTSAITAAPESTPPLTLTAKIGNQVITANSQSEFSIGGKILSPGGSPVTVSGTTYSLAPQASAIVLNGKTTPLQTPGSAAVTEKIPVSSNPEIIIGTQTAIAGGAAITVSGIVVSFPISGSSIIIGSSTEVLPNGVAPVLTIGSQIVTASKMFEYQFNGQTLSLGGAAATMSNVSVSLVPGGSKVVFQGSTLGLTSATATTGVINFTGNEEKLKPKLKQLKFVLVASILIVLLL